jgi:hypothetical protein
VINFLLTILIPRIAPNSVTTVSVRLIDLLGYVNPQGKVVVGKRWLESIGVKTAKEIREEELID